MAVSNGREGVAFYAQYWNEIQWVITDMIMRIDGWSLYDPSSPED